MGFLPRWNSPNTVEKINSFFEYLETISLAVAITLELAGMRISSDVAWVVLVISDIGRQLYGRREKALSHAKTEQAAAEANLARAALEARVIRRSVSRKLSNEEIKELIEHLRKHSGQTFTLRASRTRQEANDAKPQETNMEQSFFVMQLRGVLSASGWISENVVNLPDFRVAKGLTIFCRQGEGTNKAVAELAIALGKLDIACQVSVQPEYFPVPIIICVGLL